MSANELRTWIATLGIMASDNVITSAFWFCVWVPSAWGWSKEMKAAQDTKESE